VNDTQGGWHPPDELLTVYARGAPPASARWSVEAHTATCARCRTRLGELAADAVARVWERVDAEVDAPLPGPVERLLMRCGVPDHTARLLAATPSLRASWLLAVLFTLVCAALVSSFAFTLEAPWPYLALAPLVPLAGVAVAFGPGVDPTHETGLTAPFDSFRLVVLRTLSVLVATTVLSGAASLLLPREGLAALAWLLPALALTGTTLALATRIGPLSAAVATGLVWALAVASTVDPADGTSVLFAPAGQAAAAALASAAALAVFRARARFDTARRFDHPVRFSRRPA